MQIWLTRIAENDKVSPPEKKFRQEYVKRKNMKLHLGDQEELKNESKANNYSSSAW